MNKQLPDKQHREETASEFTPNRPNVVYLDKSGKSRETADGKGIGTAALILSILAFFIMPYLFGIAGLVMGFFAARRGGGTAGRWAIYLSIAAMVLPLFIRPFY